MAYVELTAEQWLAKCGERVQELQAKGYTWSQKLSTSYAGVVLVKGKDIYVFDLEGNEYHNPAATVIKV